MAWTVENKRKIVAYISNVNGEIFFPEYDGKFTKVSTDGIVRTEYEIRVDNEGAYTPVYAGDTISLTLG